MFWNTKNQSKIFISYRRSDAQGFAGRLSDSLEHYFGDNRVFRDIDDIRGGADFAQEIEKKLDTADAVIVLIGENWLTLTDDNGVKRLEAPNDWVTQEISVAMMHNIPIYPVLIENTPMPREDELPEKLKPLLRFNALSISDHRWHFDVLRLGKIISLDLPSANEVKIDRVKFLVSISLCLSLCFSAFMVMLNLLSKRCMIIADSDNTGLCYLWTSLKPEPHQNYLDLWQAGFPYIFILSSCLALSTISNFIDDAKRRFIYAAIGVGAVGSLFFFSIQLFLGPHEEPMTAFFGAICIVTSMFALMTMSGFKVK